MTDLMIHLAGTVRDVFAISQRRVLDIPMDDTTALMLRFESGCSGYLGSMAATGEMWRFGCFGSKGWAELRGHHTLAAKPVGGEETVTAFEHVDIECAELEAFADAVAGTAVYPVTEAQAVNNIAILEAILRSAETGELVPTSTF